MADSRMIRNQYDYLRRLDVDELERLLQLAVNPQCEDEDSDYVDALLEVILEKEQEEDTGRLSDVNEKWQEFQSHYNTEEGKSQHMYYTEEENTPNQTQAATSNVTSFPKRKLRRTLMLAAVIALLVSIMLVPVVGQKNVIQLFAQWTEEQFSFGTEPPKLTASFPEEYQDLYRVLEKYGIKNMYVPKKLPDDFVLKEQFFQISSESGNISFATNYQKQKDYIIFQLLQNAPEVDFRQEKDLKNVEIYTINNIQHYILSNNNNTTVIWYIDEFEYMIVSSLPMSDIKHIINSIYGRY